MTKPRRFSPLPWHPGPTPTATASGRLISSPTSNATTCHRHPHLLATGIRRIKVPRRPRPKTNSCRLRAPRIRGCGRHSVGMALFAAPATRPVHNWCTRLSYRGQTVWWRWLSVIQRPATQLQLLPIHLLPLMAEQLIDQHAANDGHQNTHHGQTEKGAQARVQCTVHHPTVVDAVKDKPGRRVHEISIRIQSDCVTGTSACL